LVDASAQPVGTTASAVTSLSLNPPLLLVCLDRDSRTLAAVRAHGGFAVNVLEARQRHLSANFARRGAGV
jgi:flavin reductase (DIM6/NTAB) family NADH-FMN oxidoreductase RutF